MNKKLIFVDIDGTLLDFNSQLPDLAVKAISMARANGHKVYISTGRCKPEIYDYVLNVGFDGIVGASGAYIETEGRIIGSRCIDKSELKTVIDYMKANDVEFSLEGEKGVYNTPNYINKMIEASGKDFGEDAIKKLSAVMKITDDYDRDDINKFCIIMPEGSDTKAITDYLGKYFEYDGSSISTKTARFGELTQKGITKAFGAKTLMEYYGVDLEDTIAFGDSSNDRSILEFCGVGVAMGNASDSIKELSDYVTDAVDKDGLYNGFRHFGLI